MEAQLVSQEILDALNAPSSPPPVTPHRLILEKAQSETIKPLRSDALPPNPSPTGQHSPT